MLKLIIGLLMVFTTFSCTVAECANWIKTYEHEYFTSYFDADSFIYDSEKNTVKLWEKTTYPKNNLSYVSLCHYNFNDRTSGIETIIVYEDEKIKDFEECDQIKFKSIIPDTVAEEVFKRIEFIKSLTDKNIQWQFNNILVPSPPDASSSSWIKSDLVVGFYDSSTFIRGNKPNIVYFWNQICVDNVRQLEYLMYDTITKKHALICFKKYENGVLVIDERYPILIWLDEEWPESYYSDKNYEAFFTLETLFDIQA